MPVKEDNHQPRGEIRGQTQDRRRKEEKERTGGVEIAREAVGFGEGWAS